MNWEDEKYVPEKFPQKFWVVCGNINNLNATKRHESKSSAMDESERLAKANPGKEFLVLEVIGSYKTVEPEAIWINFK
jgi:hypothetical protein